MGLPTCNRPGERGPNLEDGRRNESLRTSEERFSKIFHLSPDAIDLTRLEDGVSLDCNNSYVRLTGYSREEIIGHSTLPGDLGVWVHKEDRDGHMAELRAKGEVIGLEVPLRRKDGSIYVGTALFLQDRDRWPALQPGHDPGYH